MVCIYFYLDIGVDTRGGYNVIQNYGEGIITKFVNILIDFLGLAFIFNTPTHNPTWWYMSWAITLIFLIPYIIKEIEKYSAVIVIPLLALLSTYFGGGRIFFTYILTVCAGIVFAQNNFFDKMKEKRNASRIYEICEMIFSIVLVCFCLYFRGRIGIHWFLDTVISINVCILCQAVFIKVRVLKEILRFLGESNRSMNIFMTHTFVFLYWYKDFVYSWKFPVLILGVLTLCSVVLAEIIEYSKKVFRYDKFVACLTEKIADRLSES